MVDSITSASQYYSYLNALQGVQNTSQPVSTSPTSVTPVSAASSAKNNPSSANSASAVSTLLGGNSFEPEILSLLQSGGSGSFDPVASLLGGTSTYNPFTAVLSNLYASSAAASITQAQNNSTPPPPVSTTAPPTGSALINSLLNSLSQASIAYNNTNLQASQNIVAANSYQPDGITPITA